MKEVTDAAAADCQVFDDEPGIPIEELIGIERQQPDSRGLSASQPLSGKTGNEKKHYLGYSEKNDETRK